MNDDRLSKSCVTQPVRKRRWLRGFDRELALLEGERPEEEYTSPDHEQDVRVERECDG